MATKLSSTVRDLCMSDIHITLIHLITLLYRFWYSQLHITSFSMLTCSQVTMLVGLISHIVKAGWSQSFISRPIMTITVQWFLFWCTTGSVPFEESTLKKQKQISMHVHRLYNVYSNKMKRSFFHFNILVAGYGTIQYLSIKQITIWVLSLINFILSSAHIIQFIKTLADFWMKILINNQPTW